MSKPSWLARKLDQRRQKKATRGDSPERLAEHHAPKRGWMDRAFHAGPGGQRHSKFKD